MFKLMKPKQISTAIAAIVGHKAAYVQSVQDCAVQVIGHAIKHGDVTLATDLVGAARKHDAHILVAFLEQNGPFRYQKATKAFEKNKAWVGEFNPETLLHWETGKPVAEPKSLFDVDEAFDRFLKTCHGQLKSAKSTKNAALLVVLEDAQAKYNAARNADLAAQILAKGLTAVEEEAEANATTEPVMAEVKAA